MNHGNVHTSRHQRNDLPTVLTSFIGRAREQEDVARLLASSRLMTLIGAAGCGKTRLALRVASDMSHHFPDGIHWLELAQLTDSVLIPQTVLKVLRIPAQSGISAFERLVEVLHDEQRLLVLDNCEHVLDGCAQLVEALLAETEVCILATSREPLSITGERIYPVNSLSLPPANATDIGQYDAIRLFVERARAILPAFKLTNDNTEGVSTICQKLDGIPLAIELASARINVLTVEQIAARLDNRFHLLATSPVTHSHHDTLRAAVDWSYDLLSEPEQTLLRRLSVFAGGCSLTTAEAVCAGNPVKPGQILEVLSSLVNKSLVVAKTLNRDEARYTLLETIRQYGQEKLISAGEWESMRDRHLQCYLQLSEEMEPKTTGQYQQLWLNWLEGEHDNIRAALSWSLDSKQIAAGLRIAIALYQLWTIRDYAEEGLSWYERLLAEIDNTVSPLVHANALSYAANMSGFRGNTNKQTAYGRKAAKIAEAAGEAGRQALVWALVAQSFGARAEGDFETEFSLAKRAIGLHRELGNTYFLAISLSTTSFSAMSLGKYDEARAMLDEALPILREIGNPYRIAMALNFSGDLARCEKNYELARTVYEESMSLLREINAVRDLASVLHNLGHVYLHLGEIEPAGALFTDSMATHQSQGNHAGMAESLIGFAALAIKLGDAATGVRLLASSLAVRGQPMTAMWAATRLEYEHYLAQATEQLSAGDFENEQAIGRMLSLEQALSYAEKITAKAASTGVISGDLDDLTEREMEVAILVAQAKSNSEIADELVLSKRTVEKHIANIRSKLRFSKRTEIVRWAIDNKLVSPDE